MSREFLVDPKLRRKALGFDTIENFNDYSFSDYSMDHDAVDLMIGLWHDMGEAMDCSLPEFLGWTDEQYRIYVESDNLPW